MNFSLKNPVGIEPQKRDLVWLERLKYADAPVSFDVPEGWEIVESKFQDTPSFKQEKSIFYWIQHAHAHCVLVKTVPAGAEEEIRLPKLPAGVWPLLILEVGEGAHVTVVDDYAFEAVDAVPFRSVVMNVGANATVRWNGYQHHAEGVTSFDHKRFVLEEGARLDYFHHVIGGGNSFDEAVVELVGRASEVFSQVVFFGHANQHQEIRMNHVHVGRDTKSHMISKGAVKDTSYGGFLGYIQMEPGCSGADGNLKEHNLLLSNTSKIDAVPGLEIGHNDVKAAHAAYMERVDDEKLFYLASRGIPTEEAIELILEGFFLDAIQKMKNQTLGERVFAHILNFLR